MWFPRAVIFGVQALDTCCSSVVARGWVCTIGTFLKVGQSRGSMISLLLLSQTRPTCTHHVEVLCFRLFPRFS